MKQAILQKPTVIKPNGEELEELLGVSLSTDEEILRAAKKLNDIGIELVAVSLGADGAIFSAKDKAVRVRVPKVTVVSTVGAGDSMMAAIAYGKSLGMPLEEIARYAAAVSAATVQVEGSKPAQPERIMPLMEQIKVEYM